MNVTAPNSQERWADPVKVFDGGHGGEEFHRLIHFHAQHIADVFAAPRHRLRFGVKTRAVANLAGHFHVRQKAHFDGAQALSFAGRAAPFDVFRLCRQAPFSVGQAPPASTGRRAFTGKRSLVRPFRSAPASLLST